MKKVLPDGENAIITKHDIDRKIPRPFIQIELMAYDELYAYLNICFTFVFHTVLSLPRVFRK